MLTILLTDRQFPALATAVPPQLVPARTPAQARVFATRGRDAVVVRGIRRTRRASRAAWYGHDLGPTVGLVVACCVAALSTGARTTRCTDSAKTILHVLGCSRRGWRSGTRCERERACSCTPTTASTEWTVALRASDQRARAGEPKVRRTCSSVEASSSWVDSRVASPRNHLRVAVRLRPVQHSSA